MNVILLRLSGHSGAGKTRLVNALPRSGINCPKVIRYTSRASRPEEIDGEDYYFRSREFIEALPQKDFLVGPVRNMLQAFDLNRLEKDLKTLGLVLIEIYPALWPMLILRMKERLGENLITASVFMTAVDPGVIISLPDIPSRSEFIRQEVKKNLLWRNKDKPEDIRIRADAAPGEILEAMSPDGRRMYDRIIHSSPEGPDGEDDWTREEEPVGLAMAALQDFILLYKSLS